ncbi:MAG: hypothetical protein HY913_21430 [Desulfomonile tiedjei]|nr:hypothetical protein [Desulfomonile tiedjei]
MTPLKIGFFIVWAYLLLGPTVASAFQSHPGPEGLYAHQLAHIFFILAMAFLGYWLQVNGFTRERGWRLIQISCILLILWNIVAFTGHWLEERIPETVVSGEPDWTQRIAVNSAWTGLYYALKLDHLVSVPAMLFLLLGIRSLYRQAVTEGRRGDR